MINKTIDITVTSVHQTTAGKMIFGRLDERSDSQGPVRRKLLMPSTMPRVLSSTLAATAKLLPEGSACRARGS